MEAYRMFSHCVNSTQSMHGVSFSLIKHVTCVFLIVIKIDFLNNITSVSNASDKNENRWTTVLIYHQILKPYLEQMFGNQYIEFGIYYQRLKLQKLQCLLLNFYGEGNMSTSGIVAEEEAQRKTSESRVEQILVSFLLFLP